MVGVGAIAGTISGGYTNAARSPEPSTGVAADHAPVVSPVLARTVSVAPAESSRSNTTTVAMTMMSAAQAAPAPVADEPAPASVIAARFPSNWQQQTARASNGDNDPPQALAYAAEPQRPEPVAEPVRPAAASASSGFQLASVDPNPEPAAMPKRMVKPAAPKPAVLFNDAQLASIKARLRLTPNQEAYWPQVESALRAISWKIATQSKGIVTGKQQAQMIDPNSPEVAKLKSAAFPLIMSMREEQKQEVRQLAHTMGLKQVATMF
ncbi:MAG TPA: hypothetical protein VFB68_00935 [Xanthobacteraceae bacterium]|nr:hypothetical protein [Xanthobacteraceae bacterium]